MGIDAGLKLGIETIRSLLFSSISTNYFGITSVGLLFPARLVCITNLTNSNLFVAVTTGNTPASDGTEDQLIIPANGFKLLDVMTNHYPQDGQPMQIVKGSRFWARTATGSSDPTSGFIYVESFYGD
jgi:hypothetical protein